MGSEKRAAAIFENVEGRTRPRIDFDKRVIAAFDKKIDAVETAKSARRRYGSSPLAVAGFPARALDRPGEDCRRNERVQPALAPPIDGSVPRICALAPSARNRIETGSPAAMRWK